MRLTDDFLKEVEETQSLNDATKLVRLGARIDFQVRNEFGNIDLPSKLISDFKETTVSKEDFINAEISRLKGIYKAINICYGNYITGIRGAGLISNYIVFLTESGIKTLEPQPDEAKKFETTLSDPDRTKLCDELITEAGSDIQKYKKRFIGKIDRPTLLYLLGGDCPEKIIKIQMAGRHQNVYDLLLNISHHKNRDGGTCLPNFVKEIFCPTILLDKNGKDIPELHNSTKQQD